MDWKELANIFRTEATFASAPVGLSLSRMADAIDTAAPDAPMAAAPEVAETVEEKPEPKSKVSAK